MKHTFNVENSQLPRLYEMPFAFSMGGIVSSYLFFFSPYSGCDLTQFISVISVHGLSHLKVLDDGERYEMSHFVPFPIIKDSRCMVQNSLLIVENRYILVLFHNVLFC